MAAETVLVDPKTRKVFVMNAVAGAIWEGIEKSATRDQIVRELVRRFSVDVARAESDVDAFFVHLETAGLAEICSTEGT